MEKIKPVYAPKDFFEVIARLTPAVPVQLMESHVHFIVYECGPNYWTSTQSCYHKKFCLFIPKDIIVICIILNPLHCLAGPYNHRKPEFYSTSKDSKVIFLSFNLCTLAKIHQLAGD